jgi:hypothetical protein
MYRPKPSKRLHVLNLDNQHMQYVDINSTVNVLVNIFILEIYTLNA